MLLPSQRSPAVTDHIRTDVAYWPIASFRDNAGCRSLSETEADMNRQARMVGSVENGSKQASRHARSSIAQVPD